MRGCIQGKGKLYVFWLLFIAVAAGLYAGSLNPDPSVTVNLKDYPVYIKEGFNKEDILRLPGPDDGWIIDEGVHQVVIPNFEALNIPKRAFLSPFDEKEREYTFIIPFVLNKAQYVYLAGEPNSVPGLFLASIGDNWEIFLNGKLLKSEMYLNDEGRIVKHRNLRWVFFPIANNILVEGENILAFKIVGDPHSVDLGFNYASPYYIDKYINIANRCDETITYAFIGAYVVMGLFYLFMFIIRRTSVYYLFYSLFSLLMGIYFFVRSHSVYLFIPNSEITLKIEFFCVFLVVPMGALFIENLVLRKTFLVTRIYTAFYSFLAVIQLFFNNPFAGDILTIWQISSIGLMAVFLVLDIVGVFVHALKELKIECIDEGITLKTPQLVLKTLKETPIGNLVGAVLLSLATGVFDVFDSLFFHYGIGLSRYVFFFFTLAAGLIQARLFGKLYKRLHNANTALENSNLNLEEAVIKRTKELEIQTKVAENASRAKSEFLARMSHDIRTPLNAIMGLADVELRKNPQGETGENLEEMRNSGSILLSLINDLLDISKIESGRLEFNLVEYDPVSNIRDCVNINMVRIGEKPIEFEIEIDPTLPKRLIGDEIRVKQILNNLLSNAFKYTDAGKVTLKETCERAGDDVRLNFYISDTGRGIKDEDIAKVFLDYQRMDGAVNRNIEGTGLGLSIVKTLTELMDGEIRVDSVYGKGSTFSVLGLRQKIADAENVGEAAVNDLKTNNKRSNLKEKSEKMDFIQLPDKSILVVDDIITNLKVAQGLFAAYGMNVVLAKSGQQAIDIISNSGFEFSAVFMDHMMPGMDGIEAVRIIRNEIERDYVKTIPIIALTANALLGNDKFFIDNGFQDFISKPIDVKKLDDIIHKWIEK
jgi:signal transduction histidine kinase/CheY-like chemotaxis protein